MLNSIITLPITLPALLVCMITAIALGILTALVFSFRQHHSRSFTLTLALLPMAVSIVIMMVNGNIGAGIAVAGTFTLVRFRSIPGTAREISAIFVDMVIGFTLGMGYIGIAVIFFILASLLTILLTWMNFGVPSRVEKQLRITIPENFDYNELFELSYRIVFPDKKIPKEFIDALRARNGNLNIIINDFSEMMTL